MMGVQSFQLSLQTTLDVSTGYQILKDLLQLSQPVADRRQ